MQERLQDGWRMVLGLRGSAVRAERRLACDGVRSGGTWGRYLDRFGAVVRKARSGGDRANWG